MATNPTRCQVSVHAAVLPGRPDARWTRVWSIDAHTWENASPERQMELLAEMNGKAQGYAGMLMLQPTTVNWVNTEWVWM